MNRGAQLHEAMLSNPDSRKAIPFRGHSFDQYAVQKRRKRQGIRDIKRFHIASHFVGRAKVKVQIVTPYIANNN
jgi:hypothetical protein